MSAPGATVCEACEGHPDIVVIHVQRDLLRHVVDMFNRAEMRDETGASEGGVYRALAVSGSAKR